MEKYEGEWDNDVRRGRGSSAYTDGSSYTGEWFNDNREGVGKLLFDNGDYYDGNWLRNNKHGYGKGVHHFPNGDKYEGEWLNDYFHGQGMNYHDGSIYSGTWEQSKRAGIGKMTFPNEDFYDGEWRNDVRFVKDTDSCTLTTAINTKAGGSMDSDMERVNIPLQMEAITTATGRMISNTAMVF